MEGKGEAEAIWTDLKMHSHNIAIAVMYRPPDDRDFYQEFERQVEIVREKRNHLFIMGDLNSDLVKKKDGGGKNLKSAISGYNLKNVIKKATRLTETTETLIDVIVVNNEEKIMKSGVIDTGIADHRMIYALVRVTRPKIAPMIKFASDWKKFKADNFKKDLKMAPWHSCNVIEEVDDNLWMNEMFYKDIVTDNLLEKKAKIRSYSLPWMNSKIRKLMNQRYKQLIKANKTKKTR